MNKMSGRGVSASLVGAVLALAIVSIVPSHCHLYNNFKNWPYEVLSGDRVEDLSRVDYRLAPILDAASNPANEGPQSVYLTQKIDEAPIDYVELGREQQQLDDASQAENPTLDKEILLLKFLADSTTSSQYEATDSNSRSIMGPINDPIEFSGSVDESQTSDVAMDRLANHPGYDDGDFNETRRILGMFINDKHQLVYPNSNRQQLSPAAIRSSAGGSGSDNDDLVYRQASTQPTVSDGGEYIDHPLALLGHQYVQGGAGEGRQLLGPEGTFENVQVVKSDHAVPSYCDPPNPCPVGYTSKDGCLEQFVNSASFSREYQAKQQCACDNEHSLFNCASPVSDMTSSSSSSDNQDKVHSENGDRQQQSTGSHGHNIIDGNGSTTFFGDKLTTLARAIQNRFGSLAFIRNLISDQQIADNERDTTVDGRHNNDEDDADAYSSHEDSGSDRDMYFNRNARKAPVFMD